MPRPDLQALNINYRRIPLLSHGRDVLIDTRLIIRKLEARFPSGALGAEHNPEYRALQRLLDRWTTDAGVFNRGVQLIPTDLPNMKDPKFIKDRQTMNSAAFNVDAMNRARPEALVYMRDAFELLETTLLADGREWVFKTDKPSLGDIEAIWVLDWVVGLPGALQSTYISQNQFPKVFAYIKRFKAALKQARTAGPKPVIVKVDEVISNMAESRFYEAVGDVDAHDPTALKAGDEVTVWPIDSGSRHRDTGKLVGLTPHDMVISKRTRERNLEIHVHLPRWGFRVAKGSVAAGKM